MDGKTGEDMYQANRRKAVKGSDACEEGEDVARFREASGA